MRSTPYVNRGARLYGVAGRRSRTRVLLNSVCLSAAHLSLARYQTARGSQRSNYTETTETENPSLASTTNKRCVPSAVGRAINPRFASLGRDTRSTVGPDGEPPICPRPP